MTSSHISPGVGSTKSNTTQQEGSAILYHLPKALSPLPRPGRIVRSAKSLVLPVLSVVESLLLPFKRLAITCS